MHVFSSRLIMNSFSKILYIPHTLNFCLNRHWLATSSKSHQTIKSMTKVFDRNTKLLQRERAAAMPDNNLYDYLKEEVGYRLVDRFGYIKRVFKTGLDLGCGKGFIARNLTESNLEKYYMADQSPGTLSISSSPDWMKYEKKVVDEELPLPFEKEFFDIVFSNLSLHWVNDLPGCLKEIMRVLKKDGAFMTTMFGGQTLYELKSSFVLAELEREGGFASHVSPFTEPQDIGFLLTNAGYTLLTIDVEEIEIGYPSLFELMNDLKGMGENNAVINRKCHLHRDTLMAAAAIYQEMYGTDKGIPATFQIIFAIGWKPDPNAEVKPAERGSAQASFKDINRLEELIRESGMSGRIKFLEEMDKNRNKGDDNN